MIGHDRYVVMGLASVRSPWFREVGRWATAAAIPVDFVKCVSTEEVRARLGGGRPFSCLLLDSGLPGIDRDLIDLALESGAAVLVVDDGHHRRDWVALGATAVLPADFHRGELMEQLAQHGRPIDRTDVRHAPTTTIATADWSGRLVAVTGGRGSGSSLLAMALAQGAGRDPRYQGLTLLADLALHADQALYHDARDIIPGLQELVEAHRTGTPDLSEIRSLVFDVPDRGHHLLLGLRRHRDWAVLRPRALSGALDSIQRSYRLVVADVDADVEGEEDVGSTDIEDRNLLARSTMRRADLVVITGLATLKGLHDQLRVLHDLLGYGVPAERILPVVNRSVRTGRQRAEITATFGELSRPLSADLPSPVHVPDKRRLDDVLRDNAPLPDALVGPLTSAVLAALDRATTIDATPTDHESLAEPIPILPGSLGHFADLDDRPGDEPEAGIA